MSVTGSPFRISSFCHTGGCVGVAVDPDTVAVVSTRDSNSPVLSFSATEWAAFVDGVRDKRPARSRGRAH